MTSPSASKAYLSKSRFLSGLKCDRMLWLDAHDRDRARPPGDSQEHIFRQGNEVGRAAHALFPGGLLIEEDRESHAAAVETTRAAMADESIPALFEAAFEYQTVRIRVDILERLGTTATGTSWGLREVKSSSKVKRESHLPDLSIQLWVLEGCGIQIDSAELVHVNGQYVRGEDRIDWSAFFRRREMMDELEGLDSRALAARVGAMREILAEAVAPKRVPGDFCKRPYLCRYWDDCTADLAPTPAARNSSSPPSYSRKLGDALAEIAFPVWALDFEAIGPAIPLYPGTRPYQPIAFEWSLHRLSENGQIDHFEFLAEGRRDPRPELARALVDRVGGEAGSILCYSGYEARCLADMARRSPELADSLEEIAARLVDLLPILRRYVDHPEFGGSYSMKAVGPVLAGAVVYEDLAEVADGLSALATFAAIVEGRYSAEEEARMRAALLAYCRLDTQALMGVYQALVREAGARSARSPSTPT